jgi:hypothetical protein
MAAVTLISFNLARPQRTEARRAFGASFYRLELLDLRLNRRAGEAVT